MSVVFCSISSLVAVKIFCSSRLSSGLSESLLLSCLDVFLVLHDFLVEVDLLDGRDPFVKLQLALPLLDICIGS